MTIPLPRIVFVLGKGGVGRSTVAAALGFARAQHRERVLVLEWAVADPIAPWFGHRPAGAQPTDVSPGLSVVNFDLDEALRAYFVDHLHLGVFYRHVVHARQMRRLIDAAPGIAEMLFLGQLWWLTTLAEREAGLSFDRIVVDAPATGHGASILRLPDTLAGLNATGLLGVEIQRLVGMMTDPSWTGTLVVAAPEELAVDETLELVPLATRHLGRSPLAVLINRSVADVVTDVAHPAWLDRFEARLSPAACAGLETVYADLQSRVRFEAALRRGLVRGATQHGTFALPDLLASGGTHTPFDVVHALATHFDRHTPFAASA